VADEEARMAQDSSSEADSETTEDEDEDSSSSLQSRSGCSRSRSHAPAGHRKETDLMKDTRELFYWKGRQKELAVALWDMLDGDDRNEAQREAQLEALLNALASFIVISTGDKPFSSGLVHFLAVLGINTDTNRLRTAKNYLYILAGVVYCMRVLSVKKLLPSVYRDE